MERSSKFIDMSFATSCRVDLDAEGSGRNDEFGGRWGKVGDRVDDKRIPLQRSPPVKIISAFEGDEEEEDGREVAVEHRHKTGSVKHVSFNEEVIKIWLPETRAEAEEMRKHMNRLSSSS